MPMWMLAMVPFVCASAAEEKPVMLKLVSAAFAEGGAIPRPHRMFDAADFDRHRIKHFLHEFAKAFRFLRTC
jgi:hypothetical protein